MIRSLLLGLVLSLTGPIPEAFAERVIARFQQDQDYDACVARGGDDDWQCEIILEAWPATRPVEQH